MIQGPNVSLGPVLRADSKPLFDWINDPNLVRLHGPFKPVDEASHDRWLDGLGRDPSIVVFAIRLKAPSKLVGMVQLVGINALAKSAELRIRIGSVEDRGRGIGSEAVKLCISHAFADLHLHRVFLNVFADNAAAIRAYEKAGLRKEGIARDAAFIGGRFKDVISMARLSSD